MIQINIKIYKLIRWNKMFSHGKIWEQKGMIKYLLQLGIHMHLVFGTQFDAILCVIL